LVFSQGLNTVYETTKEGQTKV